MRHFIEPNSFSLEEQLALLDLADRMEADPAPYAHLCDGRILATLFYEPSTRTRLSFESAMLRLGGKTLGFAGAQLSSASKGETVEDTARVVSNYADVIAMRHPKEGAPLRASLSARVPVINAGDGGHAHPSQTMIDLMTIRQRKGRLDHLTIGFCGDLKFGRTVHSLTAALSQFEGNRFVFISPEDLRLPQYVKNESLEPTHQIYKETADLEAELPHLDVLYMTRIQQERFFNEEEYLRLKGCYQLDEALLQKAPQDMPVLHPLPRIDEIKKDVDDDPRAAYFDQVHNGVYIRMAIILALLGIADPVTGKKVLEAQAAEMVGKTAENCGLPTISILTPLYNTPENYLREFLGSFVNQTAPNGQLCLADASDDAHPEVERVVREYQQKNQRIVYKKVENKGIAANTNAAETLATGEYLALADHDDVLAPHAMYAMGKAVLQLREKGEPDGFLYSDEALFTKDIKKPMVGHFKPDYAPDYLLCCNYICHLAVFKRALYEQLGGERPECDGSQDHDLFLRLIEQTGGAAHLPQVLYYWRVHAGSTSGGTDAKPYVAAAAKKALADHLSRTGRTGTVEDGLFPSTYRVKWDIEGDPKVSILIPNKDHTDDLEKCLYSIWSKTEWDNFEVIVIENNSTDPATFAYYKDAEKRYEGLKVVTWPEKGFNFSAINNFGRKAAQGEYLLLLNNDVEVRNGDWLTELLRQCAHPGGAAICGAELLYPDETLQHAGVVTGLGGYAGHSHKYRKAGGSGYMFRAATVQDFSAVTGACLLVKTSVWDEVGGLDEAFAVAFNDVDFCLRVRDAGYRIAWTPYAQLTHYESKSRGGDEKDPVKARRFAAEQQRLYAVHGKANILHDPYYNPNLTMDREDFSESNDLRGLKEGRITVQWRK